MSDADADISYVHAPEASRYEVRDGDAVIGFTEYRLPDQIHVDFIHTEVDPSYGGQGLGGDLVAFALADVRGAGKRIVPHCSYVAKWIDKHPEYDDITDRP